MADALAAQAASLNADAQSARIDRASLAAAIRAQGAVFQGAMSRDHAHLFSDAVLFVTAEQVGQMSTVIAAVEVVVKLPEWGHVEAFPRPQPLPRRERGEELGVFYGYDFHLNKQGPQLIEINTNAGGGFLNALLLDSQNRTELPGSAVADENLGQTFLAMFQNEWRMNRGEAPLNTIAILDDDPEAQYLYPEFLLAKKMFESAGVAVLIAAPSALQAKDDGLYFGEQKIDLIYNRLTDFSLRQHPQLSSAYENQKVVLTPNPAHYQRYADKRNLALLSDGDWLSAAGVSKAHIDVLTQGIPQTRLVKSEAAEQWWAKRKQWFFKPVSGFGSKGAYRGEKLTKRVYTEILQSDYVAQKLAPPGERSVCLNDAEVASLKFDVRCYVYDGHIQLIAARLYQGQTTNFRTPGGGFALVRVVK